jgi:hypothetical protein
MKNRVWLMIGAFVLCMALLLLAGCKKGGRGLDKMLDEEKFDEVIQLGEKMIQADPKDYGTMIVIGDAYYRKAKKINQAAHARYTPEGAVLAKQAIDFYKKSKEINETMRVDQKISEAGVLMSP